MFWFWCLQFLILISNTWQINSVYFFQLSFLSLFIFLFPLALIFPYSSSSFYILSSTTTPNYINKGKAKIGKKLIFFIFFHTKHNFSKQLMYLYCLKSRKVVGPFMCFGAQCMNLGLFCSTGILNRKTYTCFKDYKYMLQIIAVWT